MSCLKILYVFLSGVAFVVAECPYTPAIKKIGACPNSKALPVQLENIDIILSPDDCKIQIAGCIKLLQDMKELEIKYKAYKDGLPVVTGSQKACGFKEGNFEVKCPLKKGSRICPKDVSLSIPGGAKTLGMVKGKLKVVVDMISEKGKTCLQGEGELKNK